MGLDDKGRLETRSVSDILQNLKDQIKSKFGSKADTTSTSTFTKLLEAAVGMGLAEVEKVMADILKNSTPVTATGQILDDQLWFFSRLEAKRGTGTVTITFNSNTTDGETIFEANDLTFLDTSGDKYDLQEDVIGDGTTTVDVDIIARVLGDDGNIDADEISNVEFADSATETTWNDDVSSFTNNSAFTGGRDKETDTEFRNRVRDLKAARPECSLDGMITAVSDISGVKSVTGQENTTDIGGTENTLTSAQSGTAANVTTNATNTKMAQAVFVPDERFVQHVNATLNSDADDDLVCDVTIENSNSSGEPNGTVFDSVFSAKSLDFDGTNQSSLQYDNGKYIPKFEGDTNEVKTVWVVFERTAGEGVFDGGTSVVNKLDNPSFETYTTSPGAPDNWSLQGTDATVEKETTTVDDGSNAVKITHGGTDEEGIKQTFSTEPNLTHKVQVRARTDGSAGATPRLEVVRVSDSTAVASADGTAAGTSYETLSAEFTPTARSDHEFRLIHETGSSNGDVVFFDTSQLSIVKAKHFDGSNWVSSNLEALNVDLIGGLPPHGVRLTVDGGDNEDIANAIHDSKAAGIKDDGDTEVAVTADSGQSVDRFFERPNLVDTVYSITISKDDTFTGTENDVRDIIVEYVGGDDTGGTTHDGLGVGDDIIRNEIVHLVLDDDNLVGTVDVTTMRLDKKDNTSDPANLTSTDESNIALTSDEKSNITDAANNIDVTLTDA